MWAMTATRFMRWLLWSVVAAAPDGGVAGPGREQRDQQRAAADEHAGDDVA